MDFPLPRRPLGRTGLELSPLALGGHWKGLARVLGRPFTGSGYDPQDFENILCPDVQANRDRVLSRAIELGVNYIDACSPPEILAYARLLRGRRDKVLFGYSWHTREPREPAWRTPARLVEGLKAGLAEAGLACVDLWRISLPVDGIADASERARIEEATVEGLAAARCEGLARATGVSSHDRAWLRSMLARYPADILVVLFPFPAGAKPAREASLLDAVAASGAGSIAIKPFTGGALFTGADADGRLAALALRHALAAPALTSVAAGFASE
ncbi:MAG TPA: aldo/keto reductase, partial [Bryobacteraceae bacterium]|nr:aldo/keto reductase [Bryobacteraceae bacterium]